MAHVRARRRARLPLRTLAWGFVVATVVAAGAMVWATRLPSRALPEASQMPPPGLESRPEVRPDGQGGTFTTLTHNVAGGPPWLTDVSAAETAPRIAARVNAYDLVLIQEDFTEHGTLQDGATHAYHSVPGAPSHGLFADGLGRFSRMSFVPVTRVPWQRCHGLWDAGHDCLANKGFSYAETRLANEATVDVYNLAADVGDSPQDRAARATQFDQLADALLKGSRGKAVIVAGDTSLAPDSPEDAEVLARFLDRTGLRDSCQARLCDQPSRARVFYRGGNHVSLEPVAWQRAPDLEALSGHDAVSVRFRWGLEHPDQRAAVLLP